MNQKYEIRAASCPVIINGWVTVGSFFSNGTCPRISYLRSMGIEKPVDDKSRGYFKKGIDHEEMFLKRLADEGIETAYQDAVYEQISENVSFRGSPDVFLTATQEILELKSVHSPNSYKSKFKKGYEGADFDHVVQISHYLISKQVENGRIIYTSYAEGFEGQEREAKVRFDGTVVTCGDIVIPAAGIQAGKEVLAEQLETGKLFHDMPIVHKSNQDVCSRCPMNTVCFSSMKRIKGEEFIEEAKKLGWGPRES